MDLSICIVSYNVKNDLKECLSSIQQNIHGLSYEVIVVDNDSQDGTQEMMKQDFPDICFLTNKENLGFARANNIAYQNSTGKILLFLNPDTLVKKEGFTDHVRKFSEDKRSGAMGPQLLNADNSVQKGAIRRFPGPLDTIIRFTFLRKFPLLKRIPQKYRMRDFDFSRHASVDQISGAAFFTKRDIFEKVGRFDEDFFIFYEEVDLCKRIKNMGYPVIYEPNIVIIHTGGKSRKKVNNAIRAFNIRSLLHYFRKHEKGLIKYSFLFSFKILFVLDHLLELTIDSLIYLCPFIRGNKQTERTAKRDFRIFFIKNRLTDLLFRW